MVAFIVLESTIATPSSYDLIEALKQRGMLATSEDVRSSPPKYLRNADALPVQGKDSSMYSLCGLQCA